ncbi:o-succinylbenzoate--CoA ligase [Alicyclobacillus cycloheptanicus]|uniref:2-succinylbenzoate--CoA ligase n=1 Tax=Alicyclobacillus cycloheptanicus TaxID=1457 RepID=A0ABT9XL23_9BACL|nr:o-succinylbenzoate--CoA ligase [Alicyclobacillus cycloheptanicus]MDQ0191003.1 O-succinylbenzoic acid--CoA ligase [Alicyclobacillus cycloheptanicus]WDM00897.1 o-succinylbenzoate--CoA ligase [Alicyclobacillus cycloheptanicus]
MTQQLPDWLSRRAEGNEKTVAIENGPVRLTYGQLWEQATRTAGWLSELGVDRGERVAVLVRQGHLYAVAMHGLMQLGAVLVPINRRLAPPEVAWQLQDAGVRVLLHDGPAADQALAIRDAANELAWRVALHPLDERPEPSERVARQYVRLDETHAIIYTSGTTGHPKGTLITYGNHWWGALASALQLGLHAGDRWLSPMPLFHVGGLAVLMRSLIYGTTAVLHDQFDPALVNEAIDRGDIDLVSLAPAMLQRMLAERDAPYPPRFRCALLGGSAAPRPLLERCLALGVPALQSYGLTEANSQVATLAPADALRKLGSSGRPLLPTEVEIRVEGRRAKPGEEGEIVVRGPTVTPGYFNRPDATAAAFEDGWFHTGDIGRMDEEGYLYVLDRRSDLIISGAENVYPAEVESVLMSHDAIVEACVVGQPDERWGQVPVAFLVAAADSDRVPDEALRTYCRERLAGYKVPVAFHWVDTLPRNASGKLLRKAVREWLNK